MKREKINPIDLLIDKFIQVFNENDTDKVINDVEATILLNKVIYRIADLSSYRDLVYTKFLPDINKSVIETIKHIKHSKYKQNIDPALINYQETIDDTIRLSYVAVFHKLENYLDELILAIKEYYDHIEYSTIPLNSWAKRHLEIDFKNWKLFPVTEKINWVANCVKHYDGFPKKTPKPDYGFSLSEGERIKLSKEEFKNDVTELIAVFPVYMKFLHMVAQCKMAHDQLERDRINNLINEEIERKVNLLIDSCKTFFNLIKSARNMK